MLDISLQAFFRAELLKSIDIDKIESFSGEREKLIEQFLQDLARISAENEKYINVPDARFIAEYVVDENGGYGP